MDLSKLRPGEMLAAAAGVLLFIAMFLSWYDVGGGLGGGISGRLSGFDTTASAWQSFAFLDVLLFLTAVAAVGVAVLAGTQRSVAVPVAASVVVTLLGLVATLLVLYRLLNEPFPVPDRFVSIELGAYLGFILCALIAVGGFLSMQE
jgi:hypothetical protein